MYTRVLKVIRVSATVAQTPILATTSITTNGTSSPYSHTTLKGVLIRAWEEVGAEVEESARDEGDVGIGT